MVKNLKIIIVISIPKNQSQVENIPTKIKLILFDLDIKARYGTFQEKRLFSFFCCQKIPDKSSNALSTVICSVICAESLRNAKTSNSLDSLSKAIKPLVTHMSKQDVSIRKINVNNVLIMCVKVNRKYQIQSPKL